MTVETMNNPEVIKEFLVESNDPSEDVGKYLVSLESDPQNKELLNWIFRGLFILLKATQAFWGTGSCYHWGIL